MCRLKKTSLSFILISVINIIPLFSKASSLSESIEQLKKSLSTFEKTSEVPEEILGEIIEKKDVSAEEQEKLGEKIRSKLLETFPKIKLPPPKKLHVEPKRIEIKKPIEHEEEAEETAPEEEEVEEEEPGEEPEEKPEVEEPGEEPEVEEPGEEPGEEPEVEPEVEPEEEEPEVEEPGEEPEEEEPEVEEPGEEPEEEEPEEEEPEVEEPGEEPEEEPGEEPEETEEPGVPEVMAVEETYEEPWQEAGMTQQQYQQPWAGTGMTQQSWMQKQGVTSVQQWQQQQLTQPTQTEQQESTSTSIDFILDLDDANEKTSVSALLERYIKLVDKITGPLPNVIMERGIKEREKLLKLQQQQLSTYSKTGYYAGNQPPGTTTASQAPLGLGTERREPISEFEDAVQLIPYWMVGKGGPISDLKQIKEQFEKTGEKFSMEKLSSDIKKKVEKILIDTGRKPFGKWMKEDAGDITVYVEEIHKLIPEGHATTLLYGTLLKKIVTNPQLTEGKDAFNENTIWYLEQAAYRLKPLDFKADFKIAMEGLRRTKAKRALLGPTSPSKLKIIIRNLKTMAKKIDWATIEERNKKSQMRDFAAGIRDLRRNIDLYETSKKERKQAQAVELNEKFRSLMKEVEDNEFIDDVASETKKVRNILDPLKFFTRTGIQFDTKTTVLKKMDTDTPEKAKERLSDTMKFIETIKKAQE